MSLLLATAGAIWAVAFFAVAYTAVRLVEALEGDTSECWSGSAGCGFLARAETDHDLFAVIVFGAVALVPACVFAWRAWPRLACRSARLSQ